MPVAGVSHTGRKAGTPHFGAVAGQYRPDQHPPTLPELTADSSLSDYLAYALLNSPTVETAYYDWSASVENITVARSLPDPQMTFQSYIMDIAHVADAGFLQQFPGPGKLKARPRVAVTESQGKYFAFESAVLQTAFKLKRAYYRLGLLDEQLRLKRETLTLLENQERAIRAQNGDGHGGIAGIAARSKRIGSRPHGDCQSRGFPPSDAGKFQSRAGTHAATTRSARTGAI